jgi:hypothetical protein
VYRSNIYALSPPGSPGIGLSWPPNAHRNP